MKIGLFALSFPLFNTEGGGAGAPAAPAGAPAAPAGSPGGSSGTPAPGAPGQPAGASAAPPNAPPPGFTYKEDRSNWVPSHVVRQRTEELTKLQQQLAFEQQRVAALSGVKLPAPPRNPEHDQIRNQLYEIAPELKELAELKEKIKALSGFDPKEFQALKDSQQQSWQVYGNSTLRTLIDKAKEAYGGADLSPKALRRISSAFASELQEDQEFRERYEAGDLSIIDEFIADYRGSVLDPYRRQSAAAAAPNMAAARRLPRGGGSTPVVGARPALLKPTDPNFHQDAWKRFSAATE
jgi:hypothetical protein